MGEDRYTSTLRSTIEAAITHDTVEEHLFFWKMFILYP